ncbi:DNA polymerase nu [Conger conger]|uniref:DNA polymerase nu n=1 Tax=Conger conger TaxID=82655 RepID=UPI002A5A6F7D|nr:DNA polymerase nu [Conger conger]
MLLCVSLCAAAGVDLALEKSCPFSEIPACRERTPPAPSTTGPPSPDRSRSPPCPDRSRSPPCPDRSRSPPCPDRSRSPPCPDRSRSPPCPDRSRSPPCPDRSRSPPCPDDTQGAANRAAPLKRRRASPRPRSCDRKRPGRWEPPRPSQERSGGETRTPRPPAPSPARGEGLSAHRVASETPDLPRRHPAGTRLPKPLGEKRAGRGGGRGLEPPRREEGRESSWTPTSDPAVRDVSRLSREERARVLQEAASAPALVLTMVYQDGSTQLCPLQKSCPAVSGILLLLKGSLDAAGPGEDPGSGDSLLYLRLEQRPAWAQQNQELDQNQDLFAREMVQRVVSAAQVVVCYKAKDLLRTLLQHFRGALSWKQVARCRILDPQIAAWLLDPADSASCFQDLVTKHCGTAAKPPPQPPGPRKASSPSTSLPLLYQLMTDLRSNLQTRGLWDLFSSVEISMIPVLAVMESHRIRVDTEALKRTSEMLGAKLKQLEQDAHKAAGQQFLVSSSAQLRLVLFEKLRLQERCESKKLPKTLLKQHQSTSEAALLQLQDLHPLPKIILEYRQVHKIKSTFVDGILSCVKKTCVSPTWNQTSAVSGRLSAKQPNFQALPRQPVQIIKRQYIPGMQPEVVMVHPRDMFIPQEGHTFLAADFCQVELRLLAHLTSDPELLRLFQDPDADVFTALASHWKGVPEDRLNPEDREHAKRVVYSVVYGAGRERLSGILGVSTEQASRFVDSFLQRYREVHSFIQRTVQQCQKQGYVVSIMGRRRPLPHIHSADWALRNQAERQAVNFVVQGSAADLCKMAMIRIFSLVSSSSSLTPRLLAQIHDELLFEVEDSQLEDFAALVKTAMESLRHIESLGVHLKVPLKVAVSSGGSWGSMSELRLPPAPPPRPAL